MPIANPELRTEQQINPVASEVAALTAIVRPILRGTLFALKEEAAADAGGRDKLLLRQLARVYRQGDGDCGICFEYAVHDAVLRGDAHVMDRIDSALKSCRITGGNPASILFGAEKTGAVQLIKTAKELLTKNSRLLAGVQGQPCKLKRHLESVAAAFRKAEVRNNLPWSIGGLWKADLFIGRPTSEQWVGTTVKINQDHLQGARGLRIGIVPCRQGRTDSVKKDESKNLIVCPLPHDGAFMELFYQAWAIVQQFLKADAQVPKEVYLPRAADRQVCRYLEERRDFPALDVVDALEALAQPELLQPDTIQDVIVRARGDAGQTGAVIAPVPLLLNL